MQEKLHKIGLTYIYLQDGKTTAKNHGENIMMGGLSEFDQVERFYVNGMNLKKCLITELSVKTVDVEKVGVIVCVN